MVGLVDVKLSCSELGDIYMALSILVDLLGKHDLSKTRDRIAKIYEKCREEADP